MSGGGVAYHLRPNKAVEREIFFDVLSHLQRVFPIRRYRYISMGGPYMEDFRLAYRSLGITRHVSIESKPAICARQKFNSPIGGVSFVNATMAKYIADYEADGPAIFWLDYASTDRAGQVRELQALLAKLEAGDIVKLTLNAEPTSIAPPVEAGKKRTMQELADAIIAPLKDNFDIEEKDLVDFMKTADGDIDPRLGTAKALARYTKRRAGEALKSRARDNLVLVPITAFRYTDERQQMLTLTGLVLKEKPSADQGDVDQTAKVYEVLEEVLAAQSLGSKDWEEIHLIDVPDLSIREKLTVDSVPFDRPEAEALQAMEHTLGLDDDSAQASITYYRKFARYYPLFGRLWN